MILQTRLDAMRIAVNDPLMVFAEATPDRAITRAPRVKEGVVHG